VGLSIVTPATGTVITTAEVKTLARIEDTAFDSLIALLLPAAVRKIGEAIDRPLAETGYRLSLDAFADTIELPRGPVSAIDAVYYTDADGITQTLDPGVYTLDAVSDPQWLVRNSDESWPTTDDAVNAVRIDFTAGYDASGIPLPDDIKLAVGSLVKFWFENGAEQPIPPGVWDLLSDYRRYVI
jgi:uncharacterized phiE125 gp8 family phage protein